MSSYATCLSSFLFPKSGQGPAGQVFISTYKLTLELKFRAQATESLISEDERLLKNGCCVASIVSGELDFGLVLLKC